MTMAGAASRYFVNPSVGLCEVEPANVPIDKERWVVLIKHYVAKILKHTGSGHGRRPDVYVGDAGIAFMFLRLSDCAEIPSDWNCLKHAEAYIDRAKKYSQPPNDSSGLLCGTAGINAIAAVIASRRQDAAKLSLELAKFDEGFADCRINDWDEILVGRAGFLSGCYWLNERLNPSPYANDSRIVEIGEHIISNGLKYSRSGKNPIPLMYQYHGTMYLGAAHGLCGILQVLIHDSQGNLPTDLKENVRNSIDAFVGLQECDGNFPVAFGDTPADKRLVHWCHGAPGAVYMLVKAFRVYQLSEYLESARRATDLVWERGLLRKGPGICHGVAGNAYCFLIMHRQTGELKYLHRAVEFAKFLQTEEFLKNAKKPDREYSLFEGLAGTVCFLCDLLEPQRAAFPFMNVF